MQDPASRLYMFCRTYQASQFRST
uniref:Uncharacterized protein n=1 Tax=Arundo donax TaxID=35708 RepID=A0A0A8Z521_ARUDO